MSQAETRKNILAATAYFKTQSEGYSSWGNVEVLQVAERVSAKEYLLTDERKLLDVIKDGDIQSQLSTADLFYHLFFARKKINTILITRQQYASQLKEEVPAILDDQAQLLGVSIRIAKSEEEIVKALSGRYAAVLPNGKCICLGTSIEDAYVAAQLLEKTAKVFLEAKHLGGAKAINKIEAWFMQQYYLLKYSKEATKNR